MSNSELLSAISDILDQKLDEKVTPQFHKLDERLTGVEGRLTNVEGKLSNMNESITTLTGKVKNIELTMENELVPRLSHIEQCYIDTFERYQKGTDKLDEMQRDIDVIKITVTGHSEELNKITGPYLVK